MKILSHLSWLDISFESNLFISSTISESGVPILSSKICIFLYFRCNSTSISDIVSPTKFVTC